jgi:hypothetical protein
MDLRPIETHELGDLARAAMDLLAERGDQPAFQELLAISAHVGECLGESARRVAANGSWSAVADLSGTSKQAAWQRWHG